MNGDPYCTVPEELAKKRSYVSSAANKGSATVFDLLQNCLETAIRHTFLKVHCHNNRVGDGIFGTEDRGQRLMMEAVWRSC